MLIKVILIEDKRMEGWKENGDSNTSVCRFLRYF
jgi:hypothetical protein